MGGGYLNNNKLTFNKKYIVLLLIFLIGFLTLYINTSYGLFKKKDYLTDINFVTGTLDYKIESSNLTNNNITVDAGNEYKLNLTLTSLNPIDSKYELYYLIDGKKVTNNDIEIGYTEDSIDSVKGIIAGNDGTINSNSSKNITVSIKNNSTKAVTITLGCEGGLINNELIMTKGNSLNTLIINGDIMLAYTYTGTNTKPNKFPDSDDGYYVKELTCTGGTAIWDNDNWSMKITSTSDSSLSCNATIIDKSVTENTVVANEPIISTGMIPVVYDGINWVKANSNSGWYDYDNKKWANAVTVSEENRNKYINASSGTIISMDDINTMWVWIPRYEYETITSTTATEIKVKFLNGTESNVTDNYITHPAFTFGSDELTGIWVAKFEASSDVSCTAKSGDVDTGCDVTTLNVNIKPNVTSWRGIRPSTLDLNTRAMNDSENIYGFLETEIDTHAMKNIEWGAVAYLSQSKYGRCVDGKCTEISMNSNSSFKTGYSSVEYSKDNGVLASTTGNIYGIYDMSGGAWEYVMGVIKDNLNQLPMSGRTDSYNSGYKGKLYNSGKYTDFEGREWPDEKYYDLYEFGTSDTDYTRYKLGDATTETKGWYNDGREFINANNPWMERGSSIDSTYIGIFTFSDESGYAHIYNTFRPVLVQN